MTRYIEVEEDTPYGIRVWIERRPMPSFGDTWRVLLPEIPEEGGPMSREIDEACARALGYTVDIAGEVIARTVLDGPRIVFFNEDRTGYTACPPVPAYSTDPAAARRLEDEIERRELGQEYVCALEIIVGAEFVSYEEAVWLFIRATPEQRARAFLQAIEAANHA